MSLREELESEVDTILLDRWNTRDGRIVPEPEDLQLGNDGVNLDATVLYADMDSSTVLVDTQTPKFSARIYKSYLHCAAHVVRYEDGDITAYDGDRIMGVFVGEKKDTRAVRAALKINYCVKQIINPRIAEVYPRTSFKLQQTVGVDTSKLLIARTGVRGANNLVWVGRAANYAAKLTSLGPEYPTWITGSVYDKMESSMKSSKGKAMWERRRWSNMDDLTVYRSRWTWKA